MAEEKSPKDLLTEAIKKRDDLNTFIKVLQGMLGIAEQDSPQKSSSQAQQSDIVSNGDITDPLSVVYPGLFFGKSQTQATRILLERVKRPLKVKAIVECLDKGGLKVGGKNPVVNLWGVLNRSKDFVHVPNAGCGLVDWYDPAVLAKMKKEGDKSGDKVAEEEGSIPGGKEDPQ
jgi:hypothetical protein